MPTSNDPRGRAVEIYSASQTALAEAASEGFVRRAYYDWSPAPQDEPQDDEVLGAGFHNSIDAAPAAPDLHRGGLTVDWPMDLIQCGHALAEVFGLPSTSGAGPYVHTFSSGTGQLPIRTFERKLASGQFDGAIGAVGRSIRFPIGPERGYTRLQAGYFTRQLVEQYADSIAGEPATPSLANRVPRAVGKIKLDGAELGSILTGSATVENQLDEDAYHGSRFVDDVQLIGRRAMLEMTGRFKGAALRDLGEVAAGTLLPGAHDVELAYELSASMKLVVTIRNIRFAVVGVATRGVGRLDVPLRGRAEVGASAAMCTAVLTNSQATYA